MSAEAGIIPLRKNSATAIPIGLGLPVPSPRRQRCLSCSDNGNGNGFLDVSLDSSGELLGTSPAMQLPDVIVTRRTRSDSVCGRIVDDVETGTVKYFCRSRGHGLVKPDSGSHKELFMHISDIEGEFVPRRGDKVSFRLCPIPPRFEKFQAVHVHLLNFDPESHRRWEMPETPEEIEEEKRMKTLPYDV